MSEHAGNIWYKCDLHLHTMVSRCYIDKDNTPEEWVAEAKRKGLDAVAVTDHNDYRGIDAVMEEGKKQGLAVFPGVEITCDTSKIHMLILFDTVKRAENVRDFLNRCDIDSDHIGDLLMGEPAGFIGNLVEEGKRSQSTAHREEARLGKFKHQTKQNHYASPPFAEDCPLRFLISEAMMPMMPAQMTSTAAGILKGSTPESALSAKMIRYRASVKGSMTDFFHRRSTA